VSGTILLAYLPHELDVNDSAIVKLENPDGRTNWVGRAGIMVRQGHFRAWKLGPDTWCLGFHRLTALR
jgi:hypothetical protein